MDCDNYEMDLGNLPNKFSNRAHRPKWKIRMRREITNFIPNKTTEHVVRRKQQTHQ